ncbi:MAG TPA: alkene reductase [Geminicoccaceae bacterium]|nr:alkene reductase [Geminicoccus sp.]HMU52021.1 alkene reductase [Geminicoccaceae bacterium]
MSKPSLFDPARAGAITTANRVFMAPMTRNRADRAAVPSELAPEYYRQRASAGLLITEATQVAPEGQGYPFTPGIFDESQVAAWRRVTDAVHAAGGKIALQLWHVGRISHPLLQPGGVLPVAPSAVKPAGGTFTYEGPKDFVTPRALGTDEIAGVVAQFRNGAVHAKAAGFDGVELHGANGYLIDQFLRDGTNKRTDRYGGSAANRVRFLREVTEAVVEIWGADRVGVRLSPFGAFNDMADSDPVTTFGTAAAVLSELKIAYLHMVEGSGDVPTPAELDGIRAIRAGFDGFYVANGGYDRQRALDAVASGHADAVAFAKLFISNPDLVERLRRDAPLAEPDQATFYQGGAKGYADYPPLPLAA